MSSEIVDSSAQGKGTFPEPIQATVFNSDFGSRKVWGNLVPLGLSADIEQEGWPWDRFLVNRRRLVNLTQACIDLGVRYHYGSKPAWPILPPTSAHMFGRIDCSGFVGWLLANAMGFDGLWAKGSVEQHDWIAAQGFKASSISAGMEKDGAVRIAFLPPGKWRAVGHVVLILDGQTLESCGSRGVCRRNWGSEDWMGSPDLLVFVLCPPLGFRTIKFSAAGESGVAEDLQEVA